HGRRPSPRRTRRARHPIVGVRLSPSHRSVRGTCSSLRESADCTRHLAFGTRTGVEIPYHTSNAAIRVSRQQKRIPIIGKSGYLTVRRPVSRETNIFLVDIGLRRRSAPLPCAVDAHRRGVAESIYGHTFHAPVQPAGSRRLRSTASSVLRSPSDNSGNVSSRGHGRNRFS